MSLVRNKPTKATVWLAGRLRYRPAARIYPEATDLVFGRLLARTCSGDGCIARAVWLKSPVYLLFGE